MDKFGVGENTEVISFTLVVGRCGRPICDLSVGLEKGKKVGYYVNWRFRTVKVAGEKLERTRKQVREKWIIGLMMTTEELRK